MKTVYIVRAKWDGEAKVWVASSENFTGLATEDPSLDNLMEKIPDMIIDLFEANHEINSGKIPLQMLVESPALLCA